jgi:ankyrin repeat protein
MTRSATRARRLMVAEVLGLTGLLMAGALLAGPGGASLAARPVAVAANGGASRAEAHPANKSLRAEGVAALDRNLITAASVGDADLIRRLLAAGASPRAVDERGRTALMVSVYKCNAEAARLLIQAGSDVNARDAESNTPFLLAAATGQAEVVRLAIAHGADLSSTDRYHGTALIAASQHGHADVVKLLLQAGVPVDRVNDLGWSALLEAIILGDGSERYENIVQMLLDAGADANLADRDGVSPTRHARERGYKTMVKMLMRVRGH